LAELMRLTDGNDYVGGRVSLAGAAHAAVWSL
jgi:hypothetical protein